MADSGLKKQTKTKHKTIVCRLKTSWVELQDVYSLCLVSLPTCEWMQLCES